MWWPVRWRMWWRVARWRVQESVKGVSGVRVDVVRGLHALTVFN